MVSCYGLEGIWENLTTPKGMQQEVIKLNSGTTMLIV